MLTAADKRRLVRAPRTALTDNGLGIGLVIVAARTAGSNRGSERTSAECRLSPGTEGAPQRYVGQTDTGGRGVPCMHLQQLYALCEQHGLKLSSSEVIRLVCPSCGLEDCCPDNLLAEYEQRHGEERQNGMSGANSHGPEGVK